MNHAERHALRMEGAPALVAELRKQILTAHSKVLPKSAAGKAARYTLALPRQPTPPAKQSSLHNPTGAGQPCTWSDAYCLSASQAVVEGAAQAGPVRGVVSL